MKKLYLLSMIITVATVHAMNQNNYNQDPYNQKNRFGHTPLHYSAMIETPFSRLEAKKRNLKKMDPLKASVAARFILNGGKVSIADNGGKTPYDYAVMHQKELPLVWEVIQAGKTKEDIENKVRKEKKIAFNDWLTGKSDSKDAVAWTEAMGILMQHMPQE